MSAATSVLSLKDEGCQGRKARQPLLQEEEVDDVCSIMSQVTTERESLVVALFLSLFFFLSQYHYKRPTPSQHPRMGGVVEAGVMARSGEV